MYKLFAYHSAQTCVYLSGSKCANAVTGLFLGSETAPILLHTLSGIFLMFDYNVQHFCNRKITIRATDKRQPGRAPTCGQESAHCRGVGLALPTFGLPTGRWKAPGNEVGS